MKKETTKSTWFTPSLGLRPPKGVTCLWHLFHWRKKEGLHPQLKSFHHILLNLTGFSQGVFLKIPSIRILHRTIYLCIFIYNVREIQCIDILLIYSNILKNRTLFLWGFYSTLYISLFDCFPHHMNFIQNVYMYKPLYI